MTIDAKVMDYTVLIVDDQASIRDLLEDALKREHYTVLSAASA